MYHVKAHNLNFTLPSSWSEVTLSQAIRLLAGPIDNKELLCLLTGIDEQVFRTLPIEALLSELKPIWAFLSKIPEFDAFPIPKTVTLSDGRQIDIPDRAELWTTGQKWDIDEEFKQMEADEEPVNYITTSQVLLSVLLHPQITGKRYIDIEQAHELFPLIDQLPCTIALPVSAFFLTSYLKPQRSGKISYQEVVPTPNQKRLAYFRQSWRRLCRFMRLKR